MKRLLSLTLTLALLLCLAACGVPEGAGNSDSGGDPDGAEVWAEDGYAEGRVGSLMHSYFMDFTVNSAYTAAAYHGHAAPEGKRVLVVEMTVRNTFKESISMYDIDFQGQWSASAETDEFAWPITVGEDGGELDTVAEEQLPAEYELAVDESRTGTLVFDVPADEKDFSIAYQELFADDTDGSTFFVYFTAQRK